MRLVGKITIPVRHLPQRNNSIIAPRQAQAGKQLRERDCALKLSDGEEGKCPRSRRG